MDTNYTDNNHIILVGKVTSDKVFSHEVYGERFYVFKMEIPRLSGTSDIIPITVSERLLVSEDLKIGEKVVVKGQFRSYNTYVDNKNRLILTVFAKDLITESNFTEEQEEWEKWKNLLPLFLIFAGKRLHSREPVFPHPILTVSDSLESSCLPP